MASAAAAWTLVHVNNGNRMDNDALASAPVPCLPTRWHQKLLKSSEVKVVSMYATFHESMKNYDRGPTNLNKSHLVMIKTPTKHSLSRQDIVFRYVDNHIGIVGQFLISKKG